MLKKTLMTLAVVVAAILAYAATRPGTLRVQRTANIKASPEKIYPLIDDFHTWASWSPYDTRDPAMKKVYRGASKGVGAVYEWDGNSNVGQGRMEITDASPSSAITIKLDFTRPIEGHNIAVFTLAPKGDSTDVTWTMDGPTPYVGKVMGVFFNMDKMVGDDFVTGLANLKAIAERIQR
jgi:Polyketide cyclase / dehydrase and lipid transport